MSNISPYSPDPGDTVKPNTDVQPSEENLAPDVLSQAAAIVSQQPDRNDSDEEDAMIPNYTSDVSPAVPTSEGSKNLTGGSSFYDSPILEGSSSAVGQARSDTGTREDLSMDMRRYSADIPREGYDDRKGQVILSPCASIIEAAVARIMEHGLSGVPGFFLDKDGKYHDANGNVYDKDGNLLYKEAPITVDKYGNWRDKDGNWFDKDGNPLNKDRNWLDLDGNWRDKNGNIIDKYGNWRDKDGNWFDKDGNPLDKDRIWRDRDGNWRDKDGNIVKGRKGLGREHSSLDSIRSRKGRRSTRESESSLKRHIGRQREGAYESLTESEMERAAHLEEGGEESEYEWGSEEEQGRRKDHRRRRHRRKGDKEEIEEGRIIGKKGKKKGGKVKFKTSGPASPRLPPHALDHLPTEVELAEQILKLKAIDGVVRRDKHKMSYEEFLDEASELTTKDIHEIPKDGEMRPDIGQVHDDPWDIGKEYLEEKDIYPLFQFMVTNLVRVQPSRPLDFLIDMAGEIKRQNKIRDEVNEIVASDQVDPRIASHMSEKDLEEAREREMEIRWLTQRAQRDSIDYLE